MTFDEYLQSKRIDPEAFRNHEIRQYRDWEAEFEDVHPDSFTSQKLYLINPLRRRFKLVVEKDTDKKPGPAKPAAGAKPRMGKPAMGKPSVKPKMGKPVIKPAMGKPVIKKPKSDD